jgi:arylamine N-acetyltransferase
VGSINMFPHPFYSQEQVNQYFDRINLPKHHRESLVVKEGANTNDDAAQFFLGVLQRHHLAAVPFENLNLHYSTHRGISIDTQEVFNKIAYPESGRGGYCMENNTLFGAVLRSLGYTVTSVGGRVNEAVQPMSASKNWKGPKYDGWYVNSSCSSIWLSISPRPTFNKPNPRNHMVNLVTVGEKKYLVDVGFGSNGPHQPVPLQREFDFHNVGDQSGRLVFGPISQQVGKDQPLWQYEIRNGNGKAETWTPAYCFTETEFISEDFTIINYYMSTSRESWFTFHVVCVLMLLDEAGQKIIGDLTLFNNTLKRRLGATSEVLETFTSEDERLAALAKFFNITFSKAGRESVRHTSAEIL